jgi:hypothetical protein
MDRIKSKDNQELTWIATCLTVPPLPEFSDDKNLGKSAPMRDERISVVHSIVTVADHIN